MDGWRVLSLLLPVLALAEDLDLVLYGAYGCVGRLTALHLANQTKLRWAIAGRNESKLAALAVELAATGGASSQPEIIVSALGPSVDLSWVGRAKAVATAAGPFSIHEGESLLAACAANGVHYADTSDEFYWQREMIDQYDAVARAAAAKVVLAAGFCVLAGDLGTQLVLERYGVGANATSVDAWLESYNGGLSAGVINTPKNATYPPEWASDPYVLAPDASPSLRVDSLVEGMTFPSYVVGEGAIVHNLFGPYDARLLRRTFAGRAQAVELRVGSTPQQYAAWAEFLLAHPRAWPTLTTCPAPVLLADGSWRYKFVARGAHAPRVVVLTGRGDPGYSFTSVGLAETALCLAGVTPSCASDLAGVLTPALATNRSALVARLESIGALRVEDGELDGVPAGADKEPPAAVDAGLGALLIQMRAAATTAEQRAALAALLGRV